MIDELLAKSNGLSDQKIGQSKDGPRDRRITYTAAGVDIEKGDRLVDIVKVRRYPSIRHIFGRCLLTWHEFHRSYQSRLYGQGSWVALGALEPSST